MKANDKKYRHCPRCGGTGTEVIKGWLAPYRIKCVTCDGKGGIKTKNSNQAERLNREKIYETARKMVCRMNWGQCVKFDMLRCEVDQWPVWAKEDFRIAVETLESFQKE